MKAFDLTPARSGRTSLFQSWKRRLKDTGKRLVFHLYRQAQKLGWNLFPSHYYASEPNITELDRNKADWTSPSAMRGIVTAPDKQLSRLQEYCTPYRAEYEPNEAYLTGVSRAFGPGYGYVEAQCLHAMVRHFRPARIVEVGSGVSTLVSLVAAHINQEEDANYRCALTCVEPYPSKALQLLAKKDSNLTVRQEPVQRSPTTLFSELKKGDLLFIDSSHVAKIGSDVTHLILEILPLVPAGVVIHIHDIYFPYTYQRDFLQTFLHNNETILLQAFLAFNSRFEMLFALSQMHYAFPEELAKLFPGYQPQTSDRGLRNPDTQPKQHFPSSAWLISK